MQMAGRIQAMTPSKTIELSAVMDRMRRAGRKVIDLAVGEPEAPTPKEVVEATRSALAAGETRYGPVAGMAELRETIAGGFDGWGVENVLVTNGAKQALYSIFQLLCDSGDEIVIPSPCWVSFPEQVKLAGGRPVLVPTRDHQLDIDGIRRALFRRTRAVLINSPNNPTGAVYPRADVAALARLCRRRKLFLISDEAYHGYVYGGLQPFGVHEATDLRESLIVVRSFSKRYHMTGYRVGFVAAAAPVIRALTRLQGHLTGNVCTFAQHGALQALRSGSDGWTAQLGELVQKRETAYAALSGVGKCIKPGGAFYLFPDVSSRLRKGATTLDLAARLLSTTGVAVVPGEAFAAPGSLRVSYAVPTEVLREGIERLLEAL
jgi:aspartate aminotransferase